jgi:hypothetical protein
MRGPAANTYKHQSLLRLRRINKFQGKHKGDPYADITALPKVTAVQLHEHDPVK